MTLTQLKYLVAIVEQGFNITRAAAVLHTSQPGISRQIRLMEEELGITMLSRNSGRIVGLTEEGIRVAMSAKRIVNEMTSLKLMGEEFLQQETGKLSIVTLHSFALSTLTEAIIMIRTRYPEVTIDVQHASASQCFEMMRAGGIDLGITIEEPPESYGLASLPLGTVPRVLIVPQGHPLIKRDSIGLADIASYPLIFHRSLASSGWAVARTFKKQGIELKPTVEAMDASVIKAYVEHGAGIAIISGAAYDPKRDPGLYAIDLSHIIEPSYISAVLDPFRYMRGFVYEFIEKLSPRWTKRNVDDAIRDIVSATSYPKA